MTENDKCATNRLLSKLMCFLFRHKPKFLTYNNYPGNGVWQYGCERCNLVASGYYLSQKGYDIDALHNRNQERVNDRRI